MDLKDKKKLLILASKGLGDTAMLTPIYLHLDRSGNFELSFVASNNGSSEYLESLRLGSLRQIYVWDRSRSIHSNIVRLSCQLRKTEFDLAYATFPNSKKELLLLTLCRADEKKLMHYHQGYLHFWQFVHPHAPKGIPEMHYFENNLRLFGIDKKEIALPVFKFNLSFPLRIGLHIGARGHGKNWGVNNWAKLMESLKNSFNCEFNIIAGKNELALATELMNMSDANARHLVGLRLDELNENMTNLALLVGNDSGIAHIASMHGVPTIAIWSYGEFERANPFGYGNLLIKSDFDCIPCYAPNKKYPKECGFDFQCIRTIASDIVAKIVVKYIDALLNHRIPDKATFTGIDEIKRIDIMSGGCMVLTLRK